MRSDLLSDWIQHLFLLVSKPNAISFQWLNNCLCPRIPPLAVSIRGDLLFLVARKERNHSLSQTKWIGEDGKAPKTMCGNEGSFPAQGQKTFLKYLAHLHIWLTKSSCIVSRAPPGCNSWWSLLMSLISCYGWTFTALNWTGFPIQWE